MTVGGFVWLRTKFATSMKPLISLRPTEMKVVGTPVAMPTVY